MIDLGWELTVEDFKYDESVPLDLQSPIGENEQRIATLNKGGNYYSGLGKDDAEAKASLEDSLNPHEYWLKHEQEIIDLHSGPTK